MGLFADLVEKPAININKMVDEAPEPAPKAAEIPASSPPAGEVLSAEQAPILFGLGRGAERRQQLDASLAGGTAFGRSRFASLVEEAPRQEDVQVTPQGMSRLALDEGERLKVYKDTKGIETIGVGFNLREPSNRAVFQNVVGFDVDEAVAGRPITRTQSRKLLEITAARAEQDTRSLVGNYDSLPPPVQDALTNFVFNVGKTTAGQFKNTLAAINRGDGKAAAEGLRKSAYYNQVGARGERVAQALEKLGQPAPTTVAPEPEKATSEPVAAPAALAAAGAGMVSHQVSAEKARKAAEVLVATKDVDKTWKETGVYWTADGPAEIFPDNKSELLTEQAGSYKAEQVLKHDALFVRYPQLREAPISISYTNDANKVGGSFNTETGGVSVTVMKGDKRPDGKLKSILLHELQHGVQKVDGVAGGGNPDSLEFSKAWWTKTYGAAEVKKVTSAAANLVEALDLHTGQQLADEVVDLSDDFGLSSQGGGLKEVLGLVDWEVEALKAAANGEVSDRVESVLRNLDDAIEKLDEPLPMDVLGSIDQLKRSVKKMEAKHPLLSRTEIYLAQRGEVVARFTQKNIDMSVEAMQHHGLTPDKPTDISPEFIHNKGVRKGQTIAERVAEAAKLLGKAL